MITPNGAFPHAYTTPHPADFLEVTKAVKAALGQAPTTVYQRIRAGELNAVRLGKRKWIASREEIDRYVASQLRPAHRGEAA